jgi:Novel STAND NTPase 1/TIR domain/Chlamydia polymorphic membrane protein (Chlamydia_PMP) repeat
MDRCPFCQGEVDGATRFCCQCGRVQPAQFATTLLDSETPSLIVRCPDCGSPLPAQAQSCSSCRWKPALATEQPSGDNGAKQPDLPLPGQLTAMQQASPASPGGANVFLSYSRKDHDFMLHLQTDLRAQGINIWVDSEDLKPGTPDWEEALRNAIRNVHAIVLIASPNSRQSLIVKDELQLATMYKRTIYPFWIAGQEWMEVIPLGLGSTQYIDARGASFASGVQQLVAELHMLPTRRSDLFVESSGRLEPLFEPRNPYKGLRAFGEQDAQEFFGRDKLIAELLDGLKESLAGETEGTTGTRLVAVMGPSGSGKSSVMLAGLLPSLQQDGMLLGSEHWAYLGPMTPHAHPLEKLLEVLAPQLPDRSHKTIREDLQDDTGWGLHLLVRGIVKQPEKRVVLLIDQFEELFTLTTDEREQRLFVDQLLTAVTEPGGPLIVLLTLRSDFYDRLSQYPELARLIKDHHHLVLPMELEDLRAVIEKPAALPNVQMSFEGPLVGDLLFEVQGQPGALPLLQFALDQLFQRRSGHQLTLTAYQAIGGVRRALSQQAEAIYAALPSDEHRRLARALFVRLIDPGATEQDTTRRRATLGELILPSPKQTELMRQTVDAFIAKRLLVADETAGTTRIEVSHEALIREWPRLGEWMREARKDIRLQQAISAAVANWEQHGKPADRLYRGSQLKEAEAWATRNSPSSNEVAFLRTSETHRMRSLVGAIVAVLLLISSLGIAGWFEFFQPSKTLVTTLQDSDTTVGSLRWCIDNAPSGSTIRFAPSLSGGTIKLTGDLVFSGSKSLTIMGPGANQLTITNGNNNARIHVFKGAILTISGMSFKNSETVYDAFLLNEGTLILIDSMISGNKTTATGGIGYSFGGGIENKGTGTLMLTDSTLSDNSASGWKGGQGGGIYNEGKLIVTQSTFSNNTASGNGDTSFGGGIYNVNGGTLTVTGSTFSNNSASNADSNSQGGGIDNEGIFTVTGSTFSENAASSRNSAGFGGGIFNYNTGTLTVTGSTFLKNSVISSSTSFGGAIDNQGRLTTVESTFSENAASSRNSAGFGGGILNYNTGTLTVIGSTFSANKVSGKQVDGGGGIANSGKLIAVESTFSKNAASDSHGVGGGILSVGIKSSSAFIRFSTIYGNTSYEGGGIATDSTGGSQMTISGSIIAVNNAHNGPDILGALTSGGYNLIENAIGVTGLNASTDKQVTLTELGINPILGNNGGPTQTLALLPGSKAIDAVPLQACNITITDLSGHNLTITTDQRSNHRPDGSEDLCDIGAYESSY